MKKTLVLTLMFITSLCCFASVLSPYSSKTVSTTHFEIIYSPESENTAAIIYEKGEQIYKELTDMLGIDPELRIPVVITNTYKVNNAYYTSYPYNMIVLYDQVSISDSLAVFEETMLSIFRHELTHALIYNIRGSFPQLVSDILGDYVTASSALYMDQFFTEGIAVYSESRTGEGRLNNSHVMEIIKQAKADGSFPSWSVVNGTIDTYGRGTNSYIFGGAFMNYLARTYGEETLFKYFRLSGDIHFFKLSNELFKSVFKTSPTKAWKAFKESIEVPETVHDCQSLKIDAFKSAQSFEGTSEADDYYYTASSASGDIYKVAADGSVSEKVGSVYSLYNNLDVAQNGLILASRNQMEKTALVLLDPNGNTLLSLEGEEVRGCIVQVANAFSLVTFSAENQVGRLTVYSLEPKNGKYCATAEKAIELGPDAVILSMDGTETGYVVFLLKQGLERKIVYLNLEDYSMAALEVSDILINDISCINGSESIVFSFNNTDPSDPSFSRLGLIDFIPETNSATMHLSTKDISGGIYNPSSNGQTVFYIARFKDRDEICLSDLSYFSLEYSGELSASAFTVESSTINLQTLEEDSAPYSLFKNIQRGSFLPFAFNPSKEDSANLGLTWITSDLTQSLSIVATTGYDFTDKLYYLRATATYSALPIELSLDQCLFVPTDTPSISNYVVQLTAEKAFVLNSDNRVITLSDTISINSAESFRPRNSFSANYYNAKKSGLGYYDFSAQSITLSLTSDYAGLSAALRLKPVLPFNCSGKLTYNLPLSLGASVFHYFGSSSTYLGFSAGATLFAYDFMDNLPYTLFFFKRIHLDASYQHITGIIPDRASISSNTVSASLLFDFCPIIGQGLSEITIHMGPSMTWNLKDEKPSWTFTIRMHLNQRIQKKIGYLSPVDFRKLAT